MVEAVAAAARTAAARAAIPAAGDTAVVVPIGGVEDTPAAQFIAVADIAVATATAATHTGAVTDIAAATVITATADIPGGESAGAMARITRATTMAPITIPTMPTRHIPRRTSRSTHPSAVGLHIPDTGMAVIQLSRRHMSALSDT